MTEQTHIAGQTPGEIPEVDYRRPAAGSDDRPLRDRLGAGPGRLRHHLPRARRAARPRGRDQGVPADGAGHARRAAPRCCRAPPSMAERFRLGPRALPRRGPHAGEPASRDGDRACLRLPRSQRHRLHGDGAAERRDAEDAPRARTASSAPEEVDRILWPLLDGLEQVHAAGFLHRDIKPANIMLDATGRPTLIDFGASRAAMAGRTHGADRDLHAGLCRGRAVHLGQAGSVDRHLWPLGHALSRHHRPDAAERLRPHAGRHLRAAVEVQPAGFSPGCWPASTRASPSWRSDRPQTIAGWRPILGMTEAPAADATVAIGKAPPPASRHVSTLPSPAARGPVQPDGPVAARWWPWCSFSWAVAATTTPSAAPIRRR